MKDKGISSEISLYCRWLGIYIVLLIVGAMNIGIFGSLLKLLAIVPIGIWLLFKRSFKRNRLLRVSGIYVLFCIASCLWSINQGVSAGRSISQINFLILLCSVSGYTYNSNEVDYLKKCLIWSSRVTAIVVLISADYYEGRIYLKGIIQEDPNYLCAYFLFAMIFCIIVLLQENSIKVKLISTIELIVYVYIVIGTGSRGGALAIVAASIIAFLFYRDGTKLIISSLIKRILLVILVFITLTVIASYISTDILSRFSLATLSTSSGTGRYDIWESAMNAFNESSFLRQLFGYGTGSAVSITYLFPFPYHLVFHNMFIESLLEIGVIGAVIYIVFVLSFVFEALKCKDVYCAAILIGMIVLSLSISISVFKPYWNIMIYTLVLSLSNNHIGSQGFANQISKEESKHESFGNNPLL
ncbi:O-antigen ligase family protein [Caproicibacterium sp. BJN0003]|uniref:O-antigen ligase family protein n=1 Tax=Caproicibacterium sp. BJN0003 TaxID=2994078 RepID=UPI00225A4D80|nr:O-antigen ligase family protein [Caproicibacterium sp. BJN0003]UZT81969.1 O-antigen ligase family protein [Caproicibacterium sp. BJN0003]